MLPRVVSKMRLPFVVVVVLAREKSRQVFCAAEGRELVTYDTESDSSAGLPPRARYFVMGARSVRAGRTAMELEV